MIKFQQSQALTSHFESSWSIVYYLLLNHFSFVMHNNLTIRKWLIFCRALSLLLKTFLYEKFSQLWKNRTKKGQKRPLLLLLYFQVRQSEKTNELKIDFSPSERKSTMLSSRSDQKVLNTKYSQIDRAIQKFPYMCLLQESFCIVLGMI